VVRLPAAPGSSRRAGVAGRVIPERAALRLCVTGVVQGVGFRPFVHRLALRHGLAGWVRNASGEVQIEVEGSRAGLDRFLRSLRHEAPPLARIQRIDATSCPPAGSLGFTILASAEQPDRRQPVPPDTAVCAACEAELFDPTNRRYRYPFITCTDCGPRFTVIEALPYDRQRTSMRAFTQCALCAEEYNSPSSRRYHSETNSCPACGPRLRFEPAASVPQADGPDALATAAALLSDGGILGLRGLGGFHLAADATSERAVARLRQRKHREAKPLAVMVRAMADAIRLASVGPEEQRLLASAERPVVLLQARADSPLSASVAPGLDTIGVLLPCTPLHHLLLDLVRRPLVMTSGNLSEEPIAIGNEEAQTRLASIADGFLLHDREIVTRYDDSVVRVAGAAPILLRRARGYAPLPVELPVATPRPLLAVGPHLKNTFTLAHGATAFVSQHIGDLETLETLEHFSGVLDRMRSLFRIEPEIAVRDLHPGYLSTRIAGELGLDRVIAVQHHHAHIAAVMAEHGLSAPVIGVAYDGTGYGADGNVWGAEILACDLEGFRRLAHLRYAPMPGGDAAARAPWRAALGFLATEPSVAPAFRLAFEGVGRQERAVADGQLAARLNSPLASSMGRLFDAAAAVLGVRRVSHYEGQAAMELEALAGRRAAREFPCGLDKGTDGLWRLDPVPLLVALGERRQSGADPADLAADFHASIARATAELVRRASEASGLATVALGGGVFQNARLLTSVGGLLARMGLRVLTARRLGPNDGAVSYGQAAVAAARLAREAASTKPI
jgi:hydrogenase maturation protein HypF